MASKKQHTMLTAGERAPDFELEDLSGARLTRSGIGGENPVLLAFFKVSCPVCQYTFPFLERLYRGRSNQEIGIYAISQDSAKSTREFHSEFGITMPTLLDKEGEGYSASNAYGLSQVPSLFLVEPDGVISQALMGFDKKGLLELGQRLGKAPFEPGESVPEWKPG
jgi:peroxiredoxin